MTIARTLRLGALLGTLLAAAGPAGAAPVTLFAAASLTSALRQVFPAGSRPAVDLSVASSSALARQIDVGAPADLFISANRRWMDYLQERGRIDAATRLDLLGNRLVFVSPRGETVAVALRSRFDLSAAFEGRLALGDPDYVPAGIYARQALAALGWWPLLRTRLAPAADVRAALALVERGECSLGIVYATDAAVSDRVEVVAAVPDSLHDPIRYSAAIIKGRDSPAVRQVYRRLRSTAAAAIFRRDGFTVLTAAPATAPAAVSH